MLEDVYGLLRPTPFGLGTWLGIIIGFTEAWTRSSRFNAVFFCHPAKGCKPSAWHRRASKAGGPGRAVEGVGARLP